MNLSWVISINDIQKIQNVLKDCNSDLLRRRIQLNIKKENIDITKDSIIKNLIMCLLTSQQRSGPDSPVSEFLKLKPFPISYKIIEQSENIESLLFELLQKHGLLRYINRISSFFSQNIEKIEGENWDIIKRLEILNHNQSKIAEREMADFLHNEFKGFGPKQSRNFLQSLGLTKYEIPIDSRISQWLNNFGFPIRLSSTSLSDKAFYHFVSDGIIELCEKAGIYPCELDAAIFSSFD